MKQYTEKEYFRKHIKEFTLKQKSKLINLKDIIIDNLHNICKYWIVKKIRLKAFELCKSIFNKDNLTDICKHWKDEEIKIEAKKLLNDKLNN